MKTALSIIGGIVAVWFVATFAIGVASGVKGTPVVADRTTGVSGPAQSSGGPASTAVPALEIQNTNDIQRSGRPYIVGEVVNNGSAPMHLVKVTATFYDDSGKVVGTNAQYVDNGRDVGPGARAPFEISAADAPAYKRYALIVGGQS